VFAKARMSLFGDKDEKGIIKWKNKKGFGRLWRQCD
jgi:hypothetical protein